MAKRIESLHKSRKLPIVSRNYYIKYRESDIRILGISRLEQISLLTSEIDQVSKTLANDLHISAKASFELYENTFDKLFDNFPDEFAIFSLDEIVVGAVAPIVSFSPYSYLVCI